MQQLPAWWFSTDLLTRVLTLVVLVMTIHAGILLAMRWLKYRAAIRGLSALVRMLGEDGGNHLEIALSTMRSRPSNSFSAFIAAGLEAFQLSPLSLSDNQAIEAAQRALNREQNQICASMKRGISTLALIAGLAPFLGISGTLAGVLYSFRGGSNTPTGWLGFISGSIAGALVPAGLGLLNGVLAVWFHNCLLRKMELFNVEMSKSSCRIISYLRVHRADRTGATSSAASSGWLEGRAPEDCEVLYDRHYFLVYLVGTLYLFLGLLVVEGVLR